MKIAVASDHGGFALKEALKAHLLERGFEVEDLGTHSEDSVDYPVYGEACARYVAEGKAEWTEDMWEDYSSADTETRKYLIKEWGEPKR